MCLNIHISKASVLSRNWHNVPNGEYLISALLRSPPEDPIQILAPENYPDNEREKRNQRLIEASLEIDHPWVGDQWIGVQTSPLKGVNLRANPSRRQAAVDGFTKLIQGMVAMQLYDQEQLSSSPMEVTLLHAESGHTATLFARTLHNNTQSYDAIANDEPLRISIGAGHQQSQMKTHIYRTAIHAERPYRTAIAVAGPLCCSYSWLHRNPWVSGRLCNPRSAQPAAGITVGSWLQRIQCRWSKTAISKIPFDLPIHLDWIDKRIHSDWGRRAQPVTAYWLVPVWNFPCDYCNVDKP